MSSRPWTGKRALSIANLKGGVGKSTTTMMVADALSLNWSVRVLVVDPDAQANASQMLLSFKGLQIARTSGVTLTDWVDSLVEGSDSKFYTYVKSGISGLTELSPQNMSQHGKSGSLSIVPSTPELRFSELAFDHRNYSRQDSAASTLVMTSHLRSAIESLAQSVDLVIFDCPPGFTTLTQAALNISDAIISPTLEEPIGAWSLKAFRDFGLRDTLGVL